jgi:hypothetical protein
VELRKAEEGEGDRTFEEVMSALRWEVEDSAIFERDASDEGCCCCCDGIGRCLGRW